MNWLIPLRMATGVMALALGASELSTPAAASSSSGTLLSTTVPAHDDFSNAVRLEGTNVALYSSNVGATRELFEPTSATNLAGQTLWYAWKAPFTARVKITWLNGSIGTERAIYEGPCLDRLQPVASGSGTFYFLALEGTDYYVQLDSFTGQSGTLSLSLTAQPLLRPANDDFANAADLRCVYNLDQSVSVTGATLEPGEPDHQPGQPCASVWWRWQAPQSGGAQIQYILRGSLATNATLLVYRGNSVSALTLVTNGVQLIFTVIAGSVFYVAAVVPEGTVGDVCVIATVGTGWQGTVSYPVPGNLLCEGSFEGTALQHFQCWQTTLLHIGGNMNERGGADGGIWASFGKYTPNIYVEEVLDGPSLMTKLTNHLDPVSAYLWAEFNPGYRETLTNEFWWELDPIFPFSDMLSGLNEIVHGDLIYEETRFAGVALSPRTVEVLAQNPVGEDRMYLNRLLLEDAYPAELARTRNGQLWQDFATVPGRIYQIQFAICGTNTSLRVLWNDTEIAVAHPTECAGTGWSWTVLNATATAFTSRLSFQNVGPTVALDAVSVTWESEPPSIVTPPASISSFAGASASFLVGARGTPPLYYQWFFNHVPIANETAPGLLLEPIVAGHAGSYCVLVSNAFGVTTSGPVTLTVEESALPRIVLQPFGDTVAAGSYWALSTAAVGTPPLTYQWFLDETALPGATNRRIVFESVAPPDAGLYSVRVDNPGGSVWSLPARLVVDASSSGGGAVVLANIFFGGSTNYLAPVFDVDGVTALSGAAFLAQLYAGPSVGDLRPAGAPTPFMSGLNAGLFTLKTITLPTVAPGSTAFVQVRAWQASAGASYEESRALGGKFGKSEIFQVTTSTNPATPPNLTGLKSFSLRAGLPEFTVGRIDFQEQLADGSIRWSLWGAAHSLYLVERATNGLTWKPWLVLTNLTGTASFEDATASPEGAKFYRARILD